MKKLLLVLVMMLGINTHRLTAQVTFIVQSMPADTPLQDSIYIAGDFTGWDPGSASFMLHTNTQGKWAITLAGQSAGSTIKYKFTRGSWATVEKGAGGEEIADRLFTFGIFDSVYVNILNWADNSGGGNSTAASNVTIMSTDFFMPQLNRARKIRIYFPPDYETSGLSYPVLYMHDGQNLFDVATSFAGEWQVDETLNTLASQGKNVPIVVGIDNGGADRIGEYTPWPNVQYGGGDGDKYMQFIVETLKPYIDGHYRTLPGRENTGLMGSSLGGLISHYCALRYPDIFGKAGLFSPSYWFSDSVWTFTHNSAQTENIRIYQLCGTNESAGMQGEMQRMNDSLTAVGFGQENISNKVVNGGQHNEKLWREAFGDAYLWLFDTYANSGEEPGKQDGIHCFPNPVDDVLTYSLEKTIVYDSVQLIDMKGRLIKSIMHTDENKIDVRDLLPGSYIIRCSEGEVIHQGKFIKK